MSSLRDGAAAADAGDLMGCHDAEKGCEDWAWNDECASPLSDCFCPLAVSCVLAFPPQHAACLQSQVVTPAVHSKLHVECFC